MYCIVLCSKCAHDGNLTASLWQSVVLHADTSQVAIAGYGSLPAVGAAPQPQRRAAFLIASLAALAMVACVGIAVAGYDQVGSRMACVKALILQVLFDTFFHVVGLPITAGSWNLHSVRQLHAGECTEGRESRLENAQCQFT